MIINFHLGRDSGRNFLYHIWVPFWDNSSSNLSFLQPCKGREPGTSALLSTESSLSLVGKTLEQYFCRKFDFHNPHRTDIYILNELVHNPLKFTTERSHCPEYTQFWDSIGECHTTVCLCVFSAGAFQASSPVVALTC